MQMTLAKAQEILRTEDIECWFLYCSEGSDPYFRRFISEFTTAPAVAVITRQSCDVLVHRLDADNVSSASAFSLHIYEDSAEFLQLLERILVSLKFPKRLHLNYSDFREPAVDVLGHGTYLHLTKILKKIYRLHERTITFSSADAVIFPLLDRKESSEIERMRLAAKRALEIIEETFAQVRSGMTELAIRDLAHSISRTWPAWFEAAQVTGQEFAWEAELCPIVLSGPNLTKGGHAMASNDRLDPGQTLYLDFGVTLTFADGARWSSDLQRMAYALRKNESAAPAEVARVFSTLIKAIDAGIAALRPGTPGFAVDKATRQVITQTGYPSYNHSTGHAIGETAHNPGTSLGPSRRSRSALHVQPGGVYTIEPRIAVHNGGSIEEMVLVSESGGEAISRKQTELYLIKPG